MSRYQRTAVALWICGVLAAAQLAKLSVLTPLLRARYGLTLPQTASLVSLLEVGGAALGFVAGLFVGRMGARLLLRCGLAIMAGSSLLECLQPGVGMLFGCRAAEALGYLLVVVSAPSMIIALAPGERQRTLALTLWSTFVPVGMGLGGMATGLAVARMGMVEGELIWPPLFAVAALWAVGLPSIAPARRRTALPAPAAWMLTAGFGLYTLFVCALGALLPSFLVERQGASIEEAGVLAGVVSVSTLPGSLAFVRMVATGSVAGRRAASIALLCLVAGAVSSSWIYRGDRTTATMLAATATVVLSGFARVHIFTRTPALSGAIDAADPRMATAQGLLTQFGAAGALAGPPLGALVVDRGGWPALGVMQAAMMLVLAGTLVVAERLHRT